MQQFPEKEITFSAGKKYLVVEGKGADATLKLRQLQTKEFEQMQQGVGPASEGAVKEFLEAKGCKREDRR